jgi:apolipoprotein N-acyltransferase
VLAAWTIVGIGSGIYWMLRDSKYVNNVMIPSVILLAVLCGFLIWLASRFRRSSRRFRAKPS